MIRNQQIKFEEGSRNKETDTSGRDAEGTKDGEQGAPKADGKAPVRDAQGKDGEAYEWGQDIGNRKVGNIDETAVVDVAKGGGSFAEGSFSVFNWKGYPAGGIKPTGTFRLLEGAEYTSARNLANSTNAAMRRANPEMFKRLQIHEINPVKFGGSPTDLSNKIFLTPSQHAQYTNFWNALMRSTK